MKPTFVLCKDWINYTSEMSNEDRWILLNAIMQYQNWLDPWELPYAVKIVFSHIKNFFIEQEKKYEEIKEKRSESWKKWGRPTTEKTKKANAFSEKQTKAKKTTESKQKLTETDTITDTVINSLPNGKENNSNELLGLDINSTYLLNNISDTWQNLKKFWNQEINEIMEMVASINEGAMDGTQARNRQFANNLLKKIKAMPKVVSGEITWQSVLEMVITLNKDDEYHATKLTSPENIYRHFGSLVSLARTKYQEQEKKNKKSDWVF